jgi:hypothetical protein
VIADLAGGAIHEFEAVGVPWWGALVEHEVIGGERTVLR